MTNIPNLPAELVEAFHKYRTCELTTLGKDGKPVTWPIEQYYQVEKGRFLLTTPIGLHQKVFNIRRNPHVSMLFSYPVGSGLVDPPAVLIQGTATAPDEILSDYEEVWTELRTLLSRQTLATTLSSNALFRRVFDWFFMRLLIYVTPVRVLVWEHGDFSCPPMEVEVSYVE